MSQNPKYVATLQGVPEVALWGTADLAYWATQLESAGLMPIAKDGATQLMLAAVTAKWMGLRFAELSVGVHVEGNVNGEDREGLYLVEAFNSSRLFAFCERTFFRTPYSHASVSVNASLPAGLSVGISEKQMLTASMSRELDREPTQSSDECWEGPIFLPLSPKRKQELFWAKLAGVTESFSFTESDKLEINPPPGRSDLGCLVKSGFQAREWRIRKSATHARSKTVWADSKP